MIFAMQTSWGCDAEQIVPGLFYSEGCRKVAPAGASLAVDLRLGLCAAKLLLPFPCRAETHGPGCGMWEGVHTWGPGPCAML